MDFKPLLNLYLIFYTKKSIIYTKFIKGIDIYLKKEYTKIK